jgi:hypothetical protein
MVSIADPEMQNIFDIIGELANYASVLPILRADLRRMERREGFQRVEREQAPLPCRSGSGGP